LQFPLNIRARVGAGLRIAFGKVRDEVLASTGARQEPHVSAGGLSTEAWRDYEAAMQVGTRA
jgi:hypothetical protein